MTRSFRNSSRKNKRSIKTKKNRNKSKGTRKTKYGGNKSMKKFNSLKKFQLREWVIEEFLEFKPLSSNPSAIDILERNQDKINWKNLSSNPSAIHILEQNIDKVDCVARIGR
jgi:hydroxymethylpyrimidine pyrophosphatase-like HAD family hydrolase